LTKDTENSAKPFRVLCIDGGGMRGIYTAAFLNDLQNRYAQKRGLGEHGLDIGKAFDLIVGTSTGGIIGLGLAAGISASKMLELYVRYGRRIFPKKVPSGLLATVPQLRTRSRHIAAGDAALEKALEGIFGSTTLGDLYEQRKIALAIPAVEMSQHHAWIFKSRHLPKSVGRDDDYRLVDICKATSAAPIFRSLAAIDNPNNEGHRVFADGGLYANSPVMVGLIDALKIANEDQKLELYGLGTCKRPAGQRIEKHKVHRGLIDWGFGGKAAELSIDAQDEISWQMARMLSPHFKQTIQLVQFPRGEATAETMSYLDLDDTRPEAATALIDQALADANTTLSICADPNDSNGRLLNRLLSDMPQSTGPISMDMKEFR